MAMLPVPEPEVQFCDANGIPYAGGTIATYIPGTDTFSNTYQDEAGTVLNTNPIVLDAAGRAIIWGQGDYRFVLKDSVGNLIYDQVTSVVDTSAFATVAQINTAVQAETNRAEAAEAALQTSINNEVTRAEAAENTLTTNLNNEIARAEAAEAHLQSEINALSSTGTLTFRGGSGATNSSGQLVVTFSPAFSSYCSAMVANEAGPSWLAQVSCGAVSATGGTVYVYQDAGGGVAVSGAEVFWIAVGV